jgi:flagellar hook-associated protein 3 FlgL
MITRVTTQMSMLSAQRNLQSGASKLAQLQEQASTLKAIGRPSDDPTGTGKAMVVRSAQAANAQYARNADDGAGWLATTDSVLATVYSTLNKVRDLTVQGANDAAGDSGKQAIASQIQALRADLVQDANTKYGTRYLFAGNTDAGAAYQADGTWNGAATATVDRRIADGQTVRVDTDGSAVFGSGADSVFALLDGIAADLQSGADVSARIGEVDTRLAAVRAAQSDVGVRHASVITAQSTLASAKVDLESQRSGIEDKDLAGAVLALQLQQTNYQAALAVTAKVLQPTLMDYLS